MIYNILITRTILQHGIMLFSTKIHNTNILGYFTSKLAQLTNSPTGSVTGRIIMVQLLRSYLHQSLKDSTYFKKKPSFQSETKNFQYFLSFILSLYNPELLPGNILLFKLLQFLYPLEDNSK